jgi:hypothetical protein
MGPINSKGGPRGAHPRRLNAGAAGLALLTIILSNSGQERCCLFCQHPQAHEELLVRKIVERSDVEIDILGKQRGDQLEIVSGLLLSDPLNDRRPYFVKSWASALMNCSPSLFLEPFGLPGLPGLNLVSIGEPTRTPPRRDHGDGCCWLLKSNAV